MLTMSFRWCWIFFGDCRLLSRSLLRSVRPCCASQRCSVKGSLCDSESLALYRDARSFHIYCGLRLKEHIFENSDAKERKYLVWNVLLIQEISLLKIVSSLRILSPDVAVPWKMKENDGSYGELTIDIDILRDRYKILQRTAHCTCDLFDLCDLFSCVEYAWSCGCTKAGRYFCTSCFSN